MNKSKYWYTITLFAVALIALSSSLAFFNAKQDVQNQITTGSVGVEIIELDEEGRPFSKERLHQVVPASTVVNDVSFKNIGKNPSWIRVSLEKKFNNEKLDPKLVQLNINRDKWVYHEGYYYYLDELLPGMVTQSLYDKIYFSEKMDNQYQSEELLIDIEVEAVQSEFNGDTVFEVSSWK